MAEQIPVQQLLPATAEVASVEATQHTVLLEVTDSQGVSFIAETITAQQAASLGAASQGGTIIVEAAAQPATFLGMTAPQWLSFGAGIAAGTALFCAGFRAYRTHKTRNLLKKNSHSSSPGRPLKGFRELLSTQEYVAALDADNLHSWFADHPADAEDAKFMISIPDDKVLQAVGYSPEGSDGVDFGKCLIQSVYSSRDGTVYHLRFIRFDSIDSTFQANLLEHDGLVILDP